ncbi:MAG TPA: family 10 glycosylhydrolase [Vicinamibacterales bacterium]|nr:family 10 glycosylhydrolase [Vicinamibacterales bacterium]
MKVQAPCLRGRPHAALAAALCAALVVAVALGGRALAETAAAAQPETRALWVLRTSLTSPASIASLVRTAKEQGFNTLLVQVRGRGDAYYASAVEPRAADLARQPAAFDPLATLLGEAHAAGIRVHAWMCVNLVSSAVELPATPDHLVTRHPEWLMVPRAIAQDVAHLDPVNPGYVGKIARWTRGQLETVEGLYATPLLPNAAAYVAHVVDDLARHYDVDGVHLDYVRFPTQQFDYSRFAIAEFRADLRPHLSAAARAEMDKAEADDLFAYPDRFPAEWKAFRRARLTALVAGVRQRLRTARPAALLTAAVTADAQDATDERLQDWHAWLSAGLVDAVAPMAYTQEASRFAEQIAAARAAAGSRAVWAGIGAYRLSPAQTIENIQAARRLGAAGIVLFSYDSLTGPKPPAPDYLATVSRAAFAPASADSSAR